MQAFKLFAIAAFFAVSIVGCKQRVEEQVHYGNVLYGIDTVTLYSSSTQKTRLKSPTQFYAILYSDVFRKALPSTELYDLQEASLSIGDKLLMNQMMVSSYINAPEALLPTAGEMRADITAFVQDTYIRFYQRNPSAVEAEYLKNLIERDPGISPKAIYTSFALSNEYLYY